MSKGFFLYICFMEQNVINIIVEECLTNLESVKRKKINLPELLGKCNPYPMVVNCKTPEDIVDFILQRHQQTSEQTIWGNFLESIAVKISEIKLNGYKSKEVCTDIEWVSNSKKHFRGWKSSPNWANADQKRTVINTEKELNKLDDFGSFKVLTSYGKTPNRKKSSVNFTQISGQESWEEIGNDNEMYNKVMLAVENCSNKIGLFIKSIYISDRNRAIEWINENFTDGDKLNFIKINKYVSGRDKIEVTKW